MGHYEYEYTISNATDDSVIYWSNLSLSSRKLTDFQGEKGISLLHTALFAKITHEIDFLWKKNVQIM